MKRKNEKKKKKMNVCPKTLSHPSLVMKYLHESRCAQKVALPAQPTNRHQVANNSWDGLKDGGIVSPLPHFFRF